MDQKKLIKEIDQFWDTDIIPALVDYIKIPNKSPSFDPDWEKNGYMYEALDLAVDWAEKHKPSGSKITVHKPPGKTPLILLEIPGKKSGNVLMYGHLDKQPEMEGWDPGLSPWTPVIKDDKLYGRGGADDGYAMFASIASINALIEQGINLPNIVILIEFCEESGSPDLPFYIEKCKNEIGSPDLVICLDSGAGDYKRFWSSTSLRGLIGLSLRVDGLKEGIHSGASGFIPSTFRVMRQLLSRIENEETGEIIIGELTTEIPHHRVEEAKKLISILGESKIENSFFSPSTSDPVEACLRMTWRPALSVVGSEGMPTLQNAGNVLRPFTSLKLSIRIPPLVDQFKAQEAIKKALLKNPPYGAKITLDFDEPAAGWNAPKVKDWLATSIESASKICFGESAGSIGEGGTIPFMAMLGEQFPEAQFIITGVLGPNSNAHGPNEFLHIPYAKRLTSSIALIIKDFRI